MGQNGKMLSFCGKETELDFPENGRKRNRIAGILHKVKGMNSSISNKINKETAFAMQR